MARWEADARGRLVKAAMELFQERGYGQTTVEGIAARAGLTERTFFRYFTDKREVLFSGSKDLEKTLVEMIANAPKEAAPFDVVARAFEAAGAELQALRSFSHVRARHALVVGHAALRERELIKFASLVAAATRALHARGVSEPAASLAAEAGLAIFKVGFERWLGEKKPQDLAAHIRAARDALKAIAAPTATASSTVRTARAPKRDSSTTAKSKR
jgi:AcrR family transcriptional regulator